MFSCRLVRHLSWPQNSPEYVTSSTHFCALPWAAEYEDICLSSEHTIRSARRRSPRRVTSGFAPDATDTELPAYVPMSWQGTHADFTSWVGTYMELVERCGCQNGIAPSRWCRSYFNAFAKAFQTRFWRASRTDKVAKFLINHLFQPITYRAAKQKPLLGASKPSSICWE